MKVNFLVKIKAKYSKYFGKENNYYSLKLTVQSTLLSMLHVKFGKYCSQIFIKSQRLQSSPRYLMSDLV